MVNIQPKEIKGPWDGGFVLDTHTISSTFIGYNEFGHAEFDTQRSPLGELVYRLKYKRDKTTVASIAETVAEFVKGWGIRPEVIVPMPPSKQRPDQPLFEIGEALSKILGIPLDTQLVSKVKGTPQMKDVGDYSERVAVLKDAFAVRADVAGKEVLLLDDLLQSGASMTVVAETIKKAQAKAVYSIALTRTRS
jgi:predicted amidophosphoribosyltransferase